MDLRLVTVAFDPEIGGFPARPLSEIEGEIISVVEHFFHHCDQPHLLLVVHVRLPDGRSGKPKRRRGKEWRDTLSPEEIDLFDRLRAWRNGLAQTEGVPPYVILTNQQVTEISRRRPKSQEALREIHGIGGAKMERYGRQILKVVTHVARGDTRAKPKEAESDAR